MRTDRQTSRKADMKKITVAFPNFADAHKKGNSSWNDDMFYMHFVVCVDY
jgi:hypothetical protein